MKNRNRVLCALVLLFCSVRASAGLVVGWPLAIPAPNGATDMWLKAANTDWGRQRTFTRIVVDYSYADDRTHSWGDSGRIVLTGITLTGSWDPAVRELAIHVVTTLPGRPPGPATVVLLVTWEEQGMQTQGTRFVFQF